LLLSSAAAVFDPASQAAAQGAASAVLTPPPASESCPVMFSAQRTPHGGLVTVKRPGVGEHAGALPGLGLRIDFRIPRTVGIVKVGLTVHGMSLVDGVHAMPALYGTPAGANSTETFELSGSADSPLLHPSIQTTQLSAIAWVELTRVEYSNGSTWEAAEHSRCVAAPNGFLLVGGGR
jgi:hypothetical protein